ncbi:guanylin-like isoform X2 [Pelobates fuscus]
MQLEIGLVNSVLDNCISNTLLLKETNTWKESKLIHRAKSDRTRLLAVAMKSLVLSLFLILLLWEPGSHALKVQVGEFTYTVESVKKLKKLMDEDVSPHDLCKTSKLPEEFLPVCEKEDAPDIFIKLEAAFNVDECEICANPACPGC